MRKSTIKWRHVAPAVLSIVAVVISGVGLYIQSLYGTASLSLQLTGFTVQHHGKKRVCTVDAALFNSGNRDTALLRVALRQGRTVHTKKGGSNTAYVAYQADSNPPGYVNTVVKGGDIKLLTFVFLGCKPATVESELKTGGLNRFSLVTDAVDYEGKRSQVSIAFATASMPPKGHLMFALRLGGHFNLLKNGASYRAQSNGRSYTMTITAKGEHARIQE